jgi:hypothetical protein
MPTEDDLRDALRTTAVSPDLDASRIVARARARRAPRQASGVLLGALALTGIGVLTVQTLPVTSPVAETAMVAEDSSGVGGAELADAKRAPAEKLNLCGAPVADPVPSVSGLELTVAFPERATAGAGAIEGVVRMTNTSAARVTGTTAAVPALTVARDGVTVWHTNGAMILSLVVVDLAPGEVLEYRATFDPVLCTAEDEADSFSPDLPTLEPGTYELSAAIDFAPEAPAADAPALADLVTGPSSTIVLD